MIFDYSFYVLQNEIYYAGNAIKESEVEWKHSICFRANISTTGSLH